MRPFRLFLLECVSLIQTKWEVCEAVLSVKGQKTINDGEVAGVC